MPWWTAPDLSLQTLFRSSHWPFLTRPTLKLLCISPIKSISGTIRKVCRKWRQKRGQKLRAPRVLQAGKWYGAPNFYFSERVGEGERLTLPFFYCRENVKWCGENSLETELFFLPLYSSLNPLKEAKGEARLRIADSVPVNCLKKGENKEGDRAIHHCRHHKTVMKLFLSLL